MPSFGFTDVRFGLSPNQTACSVDEATAPAELALRLALLSQAECVVAVSLSILLAAGSRFVNSARPDSGRRLFGVVGTVASPAVAILALLAGSMLSIVAEILMVMGLMLVLLVRVARGLGGKATQSQSSILTHRNQLALLCFGFGVVGTAATPLEEILMIATTNPAWHSSNVVRESCQRVCAQR